MLFFSPYRYRGQLYSIIYGQAIPSVIGQKSVALTITLYDSAIRLSELLALKVSDVNLNKDTPYLRIHGKGDKERIVSISDNAAKHLENYIHRYHMEKSSLTTELLFYTVIHEKAHAMSPGNVARIINKYAEIIRPDNPELPEKIHPHMFRNHNFYEIQTFRRITLDYAILR